MSSKHYQRRDENVAHISGVSWYAASRTDLTIGCKVKKEFKDLLNKWKSQLGCKFPPTYLSTGWS
jgi:hypothetical protein